MLEHASAGFREQVWPSLDEGARSRLEAWMSDVLRYNRAQNLISRQSPEARLDALVEECVEAAGILSRRLSAGLEWADLGSGAGIPGLILGALLPDQPLTLIERRQGRCDFLRREVATLGLERVEVMEGDIADLDFRTFPVILAKAVAPPREIEGLAGSALSGEGVLIVFGRPQDPVAEDWEVDWSERLPGEDSALRALKRV